MTRPFAVTFDYRCPFARNGHESVVAGLREGRDWDVRFVPFSLDQVHVEEGQVPAWDRDPAEWGSGVCRSAGGSLCATVRRPLPRLPHRGVCRPPRPGRPIAKEEVMRRLATEVGLDADAVAAEVAVGLGP